MRMKLFAAAVVAALVGGVPPAPASDTSSIYETLSLMRNHTVLRVAVTEARETSALKGEGPYTLFAPSDDAFKKLDDETIKKLATDRMAVKQLLRAHLVGGKLSLSDLKAMDGQRLTTLHGGALKVNDEKDGLRVGGARLVTTNIRCSNGVIHVIDAVLPGAK